MLIFRIIFNNINNIPDNFKECYVYISDVVKGNAKSYGSIIMKYINNSTANNLKSVYIIINLMSIIYEFLESISLKYGYIHNDLHSGNILFDDIEIEMNKLIKIGKNANSISERSKIGNNVVDYFTCYFLLL